MGYQKALPELRVRLEIPAKGEKAVPRDRIGQTGFQTKFGGKPNWIQNDETPECPECGDTMYFVAQIDSVGAEHRDNPLCKNRLVNRDYMFVDGGMIYVFFCYDCNQTTSLVQTH